jgi:polyamine oxidase
LTPRCLALLILTCRLLRLRRSDVKIPQFALYADHERGWYPVWQSLDMDGFFPGSGILFVTVTVRFPLRFLSARLLTTNPSQGDFSKRIELMSDELVKAEVLEVLRSMYPNTTIPEPDAFYFPRWLNDPLYRGSYSNWPSSFLRGHHTNLRATVEQRLWFGGEATSFKYFGRSGIRVSFLPLPSRAWTTDLDW